MLLTRTLIALLVIPGLPLTALAAGATGLAQPGAVVVEAPKGSVAQRAGLEQRDVILAWSRAAAPPANPKAASGSVRDPFDLEAVEVEQAPRGPLTLEGRRNGKTRSWSAPPGLPPGAWGMKTRPRLKGPLLALYEEGHEALRKKEIAAATEKWMAGAAAARAAGEPTLAIWFAARSAAALAEAAQWQEADARYAAAVAEAQGLRKPTLSAHLLREWGHVLKEPDKKRAEETYRRALAEDETVAPSGLAVALDLQALYRVLYTRDPDTGDVLQTRAGDILRRMAPDSRSLASVLNNLGLDALDRQDLVRAETLMAQSLAILEKQDPTSYDVVNGLFNQSTISHRRGDRARAEALSSRALAIQEATNPETRDMAAALMRSYMLARQRIDYPLAEELGLRVLGLVERLGLGGYEHAGAINNLGALAGDRGDLQAAESYLRRAVEVTEKWAPNSLVLAGALANLGTVLMHRGAFATAEDHLKKALAIREHQDPGGRKVAMSYGDLSSLAARRGDLDASEDYLKRAIAIAEQLEPGSELLADHVSKLGANALERKDWAAAEAHLRRALAIFRTLAPRSPYIAETLNRLGSVLSRRGDRAGALQLHEEALAMARDMTPDSLTVAEVLTSMGDEEREAGALAKAREGYQEALKIRHKLSPGSWQEADSLHALGLVSRQEGRPDARQLLCDAVAVLEQQKTRLGGTEEVRAAFSAKFGYYYHDCLEALLREGKPEDAFLVLERSRARALIALLAERDILFSADLPPELAREQRLIQADYDRVQQELSKTGDPRRQSELQARLRALGETRDAVSQRVREASPRLASLQTPAPLDLEGVRASLDPGDLLLAYSVGEDSSLLFVVSPAGSKGAGLSVHRVALGVKPLREKVESLRRLLQRPEARDTRTLTRLTTELYALLVQPAAALVGPSERLVISPDGPLHTLPFAALSRAAGTRRPRYLGQWKPLLHVASGSLYAEIRRSRRQKEAADAPLVAFGDPVYPAAGGSPRDPELRSAVTRGLGFQPLPASRREVEAIARIFGSAATAYLGEAATEERAKSVPRDVRYLHFATHGFVDDRFPLNSALALSIPESTQDGTDNGLLQAWEVFDRVRLDADLVTLSACETALGKDFGGEGLFGLTRAFLYAGARSVLASLWSVSDESTAELMRRFYGYLKDGRPKAEALRLAQVDLSGDSRFADPFHWAAFELVGDWR